LDEIIEALGAPPPRRSTSLITVDQRGLVDELTPAYNLVELGWVTDAAPYAQALCASDVLLMPSLAEAFGLMAIEAMAAARPVICFEGTALPSVTRAPECGIAVPWGNASALRDAIDSLAADPEEATRRGVLGRELAGSLYDHDRYLDGIAGVYQAALERQAWKVGA
jgi:glycosyltransferase involved in cell wall biosynthesis